MSFIWQNVFVVENPVRSMSIIMAVMYVKTVLEHTSPALIAVDCSIQMILRMEIPERVFARTAHRIIKEFVDYQPSIFDGWYFY